MSGNAANLSDLHHLHQRAKALRDRIASGPKTLAAREQILATRKAAFEAAQKALKEARAHNKNLEVQLKTIENRIEDLHAKRNAAKKQADYDALTNQIALDKSHLAKLEDEVLAAFETIETQSGELAKQEAEVKALDAEVARLRSDLEARRGTEEDQLRELEAAIAAGEVIIPEDQRDQYRRVVKQRGPDAMAAVEFESKRRDIGSCSGCYVSVTTQMMNELHNAATLTFCKTCGRILYLVEQSETALRREA